MPKHLVHFPFLFLLLTAITGVWMRLFPILNHIQIIPYDHILHGHSHVAVLGWTFLAVLVLYLKVTWEHLIHQKQAIVLVFITFITTCMMFIAFLWQGYALYSIILSTVHILVEYWAIVFVYRSLKTVPNMPKISKWFIN
ncbi:MAG TPA: hypothetical protein VK085_06240, partial [Pseudogracilibacillus sp.]|nr:hypothetical protein [Pseudogracilibacillus sp.]